MHVHAGDGLGMRTTIEITEEQRAELLRLAARRGHKGFSGIVREALEQYLARQNQRQDAIKAALGVEGALSADAAEIMRDEIARVRENWR